MVKAPLRILVVESEICGSLEQGFLLQTSKLLGVIVCSLWDFRITNSTQSNLTYFSL